MGVYVINTDATYTNDVYVHEVYTTSEPTPDATTSGDAASDGDNGQDADDSAPTKTSAGLVGALLFVVVIIVVVLLSRRLRHRKQNKRRDRGDAEDSSSMSSASNDNDDLEMDPIEKLRHQISTTSTDSSRFPMWKLIDERVKAGVNETLIDTKRLVMGNVLGKGKHVTNAASPTTVRVGAIDAHRLAFFSFIHSLTGQLTPRASI